MHLWHYGQTQIMPIIQSGFQEIQGIWHEFSSCLLIVWCQLQAAEQTIKTLKTQHCFFKPISQLVPVIVWCLVFISYYTMQDFSNSLPISWAFCINFLTDPPVRSLPWYAPLVTLKHSKKCSSICCCKVLSSFPNFWSSCHAFVSSELFSFISFSIFSSW